MAKQLTEWLNEFVEKGADPSDITDWPENAGGGSGEPAEVEELPTPAAAEMGKVYKTEDGKLWTCKVETVTIYDIIAGHNYKLVESIAYNTLHDIASDLTRDFSRPWSQQLIQGEKRPIFSFSTDNYNFKYEVNPENYASFNLLRSIGF